MSSALQVDASATRNAFVNLLTAGPQASEDLVTAVVEAVMEDARGEDARGEANPDATSTFNELLPQSRGFRLGNRPEFPGEEVEADRAWCLMRVLVGLARQEVVTGDGKGRRVWGWESLSRDAQGWCWALLWCREPARFSEKAHRALIEAKALAAQIVPIPESCPHLPRQSDRCAEADILNGTE
jgi:hypothetical protein